MKIYIAGKMRGIPHYNFPAFDEKRDELKALGHHVISPADLDRLYLGFDPYADENDTWEADGFDMRGAIRRDVAAVITCDALYLLPGWETSVGAKAEKAIAEWAGMTVFYPGDKVPSARPKEPEAKPYHE